MKRIKSAFLLAFLLACFLAPQIVHAQQRTITGTVTGEDGLGLPGVSVSVKGTTTGAATDIDGKYALKVPQDAQFLVFSSVGMQTQEITIGASNNISIVMKSATIGVDEVVITALGISREKKSLGYAVQDVKAEELTQAASSDLSTALQGKMSGLEIRPSSGMPGASSLITIRGARSFTGNNAPLYVVDGMPIASNSDMSTGNSVTGTDFANRAIDIDPNDIENIEVLKGQAAAALYGIRASNGVIVITTKSGKGAAKGKPIVTVSTNTSFDNVSRFPDLQKEFAQGSGGKYNPGTSLSWGPKIEDLPNDAKYGGNVPNKLNGNDANKYQGMYYVPQRANAGLNPWVRPQVYHNDKEFFNTGITQSNSISVMQGLEKGSYAFSVGNTHQKGIVPHTGMDRYNAKLTAESKLSKNFTTGFTGNYIKSSINKMPAGNDAIIATVWPAPPSYDLKGIPSYFKDEPFKPNGYRGGAFKNPYWTTQNNKFTENSNRFFGNAYLTFDTDLGKENMKLTAKYQLGIDTYTTLYQDLWSYGNKGSNDNGKTEEYSYTNNDLNSLLTIQYNWDINSDLNLNAVIGNEIVDNNNTYIWAYGSDFLIKGWNHINNAVNKDAAKRKNRNRTVGFFVNASLSFKRMLYLNLTGRQDYVSSMPNGNRSFFYPSVSLGFIFTELGMLKDNSILNYGKLRVSYAQVGQAGNFKNNYFVTPSYGGGFYSGSPIIYPINDQKSFIHSNTVFDIALKPQNTTSYEFGADLHFLNNMIMLNYTFSRQNVVDQIFSVPLDGSTGAYSRLTNGGKIHTNAHEITLSINPIKTKDWDWNIGFNFSKIDNYVDELAPGVESIFLGGFVTPQVRAGIGNKFPVIYGSSFKRDEQGRKLVDNQGFFIKGEDKVIGEVSPNFILGMNTKLRFKMLTLSAVLDWKNGGQMYGGTVGLLGLYGVSKESAEARKNGLVADGYKIDGTKNDIKISPEKAFDYYDNNTNIDESSVYDNSFLKLREIALRYEILKKKNLSLSLNLFARNILLWTNYPHLDPESTQGNTNMGGSFERFSLPQTTSYGFGINFQF